MLGGPPASFGLETNADATLQIVGAANVCIDFADLMGFVGILAAAYPTFRFRNIRKIRRNLQCTYRMHGYAGHAVTSGGMVGAMAM